MEGNRVGIVRMVWLERYPMAEGCLLVADASEGQRERDDGQ